MSAAKRRFLHDLWKLTKPYWKSEEKLKSGLLLVAIIGMSLGIVYLNVLFNEWNNLFYTSLQEKDVAAFFRLLGRFTILAVIFIIVAVYQIYLRQMLQIRWRRWLTERCTHRWLTPHNAYRLRFENGLTDNPDQRISEDIGQFVEQTLSLSLGFIESVVSLASFSVILWNLSGDIHLLNLPIPGSMLWAALLYAGAGSLLTHYIGRPLIRLNFLQQRYEADYRFNLVRVRENAEAIGLYGGEKQEADELSFRFRNVVMNWWDIMRRQKRLTWFSAGYSQAAVIFPFLVASPLYFSGSIQLGGLMQTASAFGHVQSALSWFIDAYTRLAAWKATVDRLTGFEAALENLAARRGEGLDREHDPAATGMHLHDLRLSLPHDGTLLSGTSFTLSPGERVMLTGPSGCGKSTLFRALGGLWPFAGGRLVMPENERILFLPQKPYLPITTLADAAAYPDAADRHGPETIAAALTDCGLSHLTSLLDEERHWDQTLSVGEQQRLSFARALLIAPRWLFCDEATSALDETSEKALYSLLVTRLPETAILSISHRPALAAFHHRVARFVPTGGAPAWRLETGMIAENPAVG
ncbi:ABC transporter ATP-binding protein/permease [Desulfovibrio sulfodismutans]|uniref:ABC transporter ATP-binding protein/permease n=1 Tax=Desulfolutivibrio sulfodismutans TaxID=63561 RepID=A0A7K3NRL3_9BACT|nr:ABC transporter ATP-binding protein/permease [Desulfolutivibrio sulfodismutans]NDY58463.1 ABC transporter ATP-binding protein/permease [Desulfolutivibrio sulfodismutans]QLA13867.1 ATP-binding cassette domain-containing protein [Desulfolutivibrio sulfodismutans DSM 3696]